MQDLHLVTRRHFFRSAALAAGAPFAAAIASNPVLAAAANPDRTLRVADVLSMTPVDMARESRVVSAARTWLEGCAKRLNDAKLRQTVLDVMADPVPTVAVGLDEAACLETLRTEGLIDKSRTTLLPPLPGDKRSAPQPYWSAPGSGYSSPVFGLKLDRDAAVGAELLHDLHKPWVLQWLEDGSIRAEAQLAKTGEHHVLSIAESMKRGVAPHICVAQACAHEHPGTPAGEALVVGFIRAAARIAGLDPIKAGFLAEDGKTLALPRRMEGFVVHLADHDFVVAGPACQWSAAALSTLFADKYGVKERAAKNKLRNYVLANLTAMRLYGTLSSKGEKAFADEVARVLKA